MVRSNHGTKSVRERSNERIKYPKSQPIMGQSNHGTK